MISQRYGQQLLTEVKKYSSLYNDNDLEKVIREVVDSKDLSQILEVIRQIGKMSKEHKQIDGTKLVELFYKFLGALQVDEEFEHIKASADCSLQELKSQLDELIGLDNVKRQVQDLIDYNTIQQLRVKNGLKKPDKTMHMAFIGNPGTAKTTVARIVGRMYKAIGLLSKGHFIEASRTDMIAEYQGQTAQKVKRLVKRAKGGVLFIDEAYSITENNHSDSYGRECLTELTKALEDYRDDLVVIVAGYPDLMNAFFDSNPGLKSRFNTFLTFDDYSVEQLLEIFRFLCKKNDYSFDLVTIEKVKCVLTEQVEKHESGFPNGRFVRNLLDDAILNQARRLAKMDREISKVDLVALRPEDIEMA